MSATVRGSEETRALAADLARRVEKPVGAVLAAALDADERDLFSRDLDDGYARLAANPEAWAAVPAERAGAAGVLV